MERLDAFMARANAAYYAERDPFRDFTTSPEVTQVFGELLGLWAAVTWEGMGRPRPVRLVECGPGRGTLMADALRAVARAAPGFRAAADVHLIETSARLRAIQAQAVPGAAWHAGLESVPPGPMLLLGNEFLDALPIRQFVRQADGWAERFVRSGAFVECPAEGPDVAARPGEVIEVGAAARAFVAAVAGRVAAQGGAGLFLDYGPAESGPGESLQALLAGKPADPLVAPGQADLTAHVDFPAVAVAAREAGAAVHGPVKQGVFLTRLGLFQRSGQIARTQGPARAAGLMQAAQRLAEPAGMGALFKVLCVCEPGMPVPPGFET